jgi:DNA-binding beta-propeller fold protein YncE
MTRLSVAAGTLLLALAASSPASAAPAHKVVDRLSGPDGSWDYISVDHAGGRLLVGRGDGVTAFPLTPGAKGVAFVTGGRAHAAMAVDSGKAVLVTFGADNKAVLYDRAGAVLAEIATGANPDDAVADPKSGLILVMDHTGGDVTLINLKTRKSVGSIPVGGALEAAAVDGAGHAFVNVEDKNEIAVIDIAARKVVARYPLAGCEGPTGIAYVPEGKRLIVACDGVAGVVDAATGQMLKTIKIGDGADGVAYDPVRKLAYVPAGRDGTLAVLSVSAKDVVLAETVATQEGARTLAVDPESGKVYLPAATMGKPVKGRRPVQEPGSFVVLVVGQ